MNLNRVHQSPQQTCDELVARYRSELAQVRRDIVAATKRNTEVWGGDFPDPAEMHGMMSCTSVRGLLLKIRNGGTRNPEVPPAGFHTWCGQGMSVVLKDGKGWQCRVRKAPSEYLEGQGERLVVKKKGPTKASQPAPAFPAATSDEAGLAGQLPLGEEFEHLPRSSANYDWFVLWSLAEDAIQVSSVVLAAVQNIDSASQVTIIAQTPLPHEAAARPPQAAPTGDFELWVPQKETGDSSA